MWVWNVLHAACWKYRMQNYAKTRHLCTIAQLCMSGYIFATKAFINNRKKNLLNGNISSTRPHNMANVSPLTAEISWWVWGTPANFNRFRVLASLLHWHHSVEVNQTLRGVWPSPGRVQYIYIYIYFWGLLSPNRILPCAEFTSWPSLALSCIGSVTARHLSSGHQPNFAAWYLHATVRPSHLTLGSRTV